MRALLSKILSVFGLNGKREEEQEYNSLALPIEAIKYSLKDLLYGFEHYKELFGDTDKAVEQVIKDFDASITHHILNREYESEDLNQYYWLCYTFLEKANTFRSLGLEKIAISLESAFYMLDSVLSAIDGLQGSEFKSEAVFEKEKQELIKDIKEIKDDVEEELKELDNYLPVLSYSLKSINEGLIGALEEYINKMKLKVKQS